MRFQYLLLITLSSCLLNSCKDNKEHALTDQSHSEFATVVDSNAPRRITRNVKLTPAGELLIAAYDDVIRYDGKTFTPVEKVGEIESWYAFDALEASNGDIWVASDQSGAYRIASKTGEITHFTPENGLGHLRNMVVYEDSGGTIWIGGQGGLSRFNGKDFETFTTADGLPHNDINTLLEDSSGILWFGTRGNAGYYDGDYFMELQNDQGEPFFNVWSIMEDSSGTIWLVDYKGLWKFQYGHFTFVSGGVWKVYERRNKDLILTALFPSSRSELKRIAVVSSNEDSLEMESLFQSETMLFGMVEDQDENIWIGGGDGLWKYTNNEVTYYTGNPK